MAAVLCAPAPLLAQGTYDATLVVTEGAFQLKTALGSGQLEAGCTDH